MAKHKSLLIILGAVSFLVQLTLILTFVSGFSEPRKNPSPVKSVEAPPSIHTTKSPVPDYTYDVPNVNPPNVNKPKVCNRKWYC